MSFLFLLFSFFFSENGGVKIEKQLLYDRHTLEDNYEYRKVERSFQWDKIAGMIDSLLNFENQAKEFGALSNYKNRNGRAPLSDSSRKDAYRAIEDKYGVKRDQSVPFYKTGNWEVPERYGRDGALVSVIRDSAGFLLVTPSSFGGIGDLYNFDLAPSLTLGCGSWGGNSVSENVGVKHLINIKTVAERRENMLWFRAPEKVYIKKGCLPVALDEVGTVMGKKRAFIVTDSFLYKNGYSKPITDKLDELGIVNTTFFDVAPDPTLACAKEGWAQMKAFEPDVIIALGGGSAMDAAKIMWVMYEHPEVDFYDLAMRFMDIRKRVYTFPKMGEKAYFIAVPTSAGTGSEVTPFAVITDESTGTKYPLADYQLMPNMAIVDADFHMTAPKGLTAASGIDAVTHALEAYASMMATEYTDGLAIEALKNIFEYLPRAYDNGQNDPVAREKMANAATMAGMAFANAFLGVCHSMAHKLGAYHHLPHGVANALMIDYVLEFNAAEVPAKMGTFSQYDYPKTLRRYAEVAEALGVSGRNDEAKLKGLIKKIDDLKEYVGIKKTIKDYGVDEKYFLDTLDQMTEDAFDDQCTGANPRLPLMSEIKDMYLRAYYGK